MEEGKLTKGLRALHKTKKEKTSRRVKRRKEKKKVGPARGKKKRRLAQGFVVKERAVRGQLSKSATPAMVLGRKLKDFWGDQGGSFSRLQRSAIRNFVTKESLSSPVDSSASWTRTRMSRRIHFGRSFCSKTQSQTRT